MKRALIVILAFAILFAIAMLVASAVSAAPDEAPDARIVCTWRGPYPCPYPGCTERYVRFCRRVPDARYPDQ